MERVDDGNMAGSSSATGSSSAAGSAGPPSGGSAGAVRQPIVVWLLAFTVVYALIWYYKINKELKQYSPAIKVSPGVALLAVTLGVFLIVPPIVSWFSTAGRIKKAQEIAGIQASCSGLLAFVLSYVTFGTFYLQSELNKVWARYGNLPAGSALPR